MEFTQLYRIFVFCYVNLLANLMFLWILIILPQVLMKNYGITNDTDRAHYAGLIYVAPFYGNILGAFIWPYALKIMSKRAAILLALSLQATFNACIGLSGKVEFLIAMRFCLGASHSMRSVGKDFIFEFSKPGHRLAVFSVKSVTKLFASFLGPFLGYCIYYYSGYNLEATCLYMSLITIIGIFLYFQAFFFNFTSVDDEEKKPEESAAQDNDELQVLLKEATDTTSNVTGFNNYLSETEIQNRFDADNSETSSVTESIISRADRRVINERKKQKGMGEVAKVLVKDVYIRNLMIVDTISGLVFKATIFVTVLFLEEAWQHGGFGIAPGTLSRINLLSFIPAVGCLVLTPVIVPKYISLLWYMRILLPIFIFMLLSGPLCRDRRSSVGHERYIWIIIVVQTTIYSLNPRVYSALLSYTINSWADKYSRTALNSINFLISSLLSAFVLTLVAPIYTFSMFSPYAKEWAPYSKYIIFGILSFFVLIAIVLMKPKPLHPRSINSKPDEPKITN